jgi:predicted CopG family antitoxin
MDKFHELHKLTTISITKVNYDKLKKLGYTSESFNDVVSRLLANVEKERKSRI